MYPFSQYISESYTFVSSPIKTPKRLIEYLSDLFQDDNIGLSANLLLERFHEREKIGSTVLGQGVALPRCKVEFLETPVIAVLTLQEPILSMGDEPIDIIVAMAFPMGDTDDVLCHEILESIIGAFQDKSLLSAVRSASSNNALYKLLI